MEENTSQILEGDVFECLKNIRKNIDKLLEIDNGLGAIFNTGFNYSIAIVDAKLSGQELKQSDYIDLVLKAVGVDIDQVIANHIGSRAVNGEGGDCNCGDQSSCNSADYDADKIDDKIVDFIINNKDIDEVDDGIDLMTDDEYKKFIEDNLKEFKKSL